MKPANLKLSFLGGVGEVGKNMMALEYQNDIILIDSGLAFPSDEMMGVDLVIPDITYLIANKQKIRAIILTHGHEDHIGALPYVLQDIKAPIYGSKLTCALVENKFREHKKVACKLNVIKPKQVIKAGCFSIEFLKVTHSISGAMALCITTPIGVYIHTGDFKIDFTPIDGDPMDLIRLAEISKKGVLLLTSDSTNAERPGYSMSEKKVGVTLDGLFAQNKQKRIIIATFASNIHRIQQVLDLCEKYGRKVVFTGRSMLNVCETASKIGELKFNRELLGDINNVDKMDDDKTLILCTGSQGEANSALSRMADGQFNKIEINENDFVIFSSSSIPGNEKNINDVINQLYRRGASVIYEGLASVHVSGHAYQDELKTMLSLVKPKFFVPCHGEFRHLKAHARLAEEIGINPRNIVIPDLGDSISLSRNVIKKSGTVPAGIRLVDGYEVSEAGGAVQRDRALLAEEGMCVVALSVSKTTGSLSSKPELISRGFIYMRDNTEIIEEAKDLIINTILNCNFKTQDWNNIKQNLKKVLTNFFYKRMKRKPMIVPVIIETK